MKDAKPVLKPLAELWPEVNKIAIEMAKDIALKINYMNIENHPEIIKEINKCGYWRQGLLELVIAELENRV